jgi:lipocalin
MKQASLILILIMSAMVCNAQQSDIDRTTVGTLDVERYMGTWFEVARYDHSFERGLEHCKAQYTLLADGRIVVENSGIDSRNGKFKLSVGKAKAGERAGQLRVSFFLFFYSDYNILALGKDYDWHWWVANPQTTYGFSRARHHYPQRRYNTSST